MKIGIITWFTGPNYGTNLQAIALQYYLRKEGHNVNIINYEVEPPIKNKETILFLNRLLSQPKKYLIKIFLKKYQSQIKERDEKLTKAIENNCILTKRITAIKDLIKVCNDFDLLICGSDQIWNPNWYDRFYYADYDGIRTRRISYAPSVGVNDIANDIKPEITRSIKKFDNVSVRERQSAELLSTFLNQYPEVVVDPTLLLSRNDWDQIFPPKNICREKKDFVLAFFLDDKAEHLKAAKKFANSKECSFVLVPYKGITYLQNVELCANAGLEDLLDLIRNARYVVTDSFHLTVFSIIFRKQFFTFQRFIEDSFTSQNVRITNLLDIVNLRDRLIPYGSKYIENRQSIDYDEHVSTLNKEIQKSKTFLIRSIKNVKI